MTVGLALTRAGVDSTAGGIAQSLNKAFEEVRLFQEYLASKTDQELTDEFGYTAQEVAQIKSAFSDLEQLRTIYEGTATLGSPKDFRAFTKLLWGLGF